MALICPHCKVAEAIAYVENEDGKTLFPCLFCDQSPSGDAFSRTRVTARCSTAACAGMVEDRYEFGARGRVTTVNRKACRSCGSSRTGDSRNGSSVGGRTVPYPWL
ncbi:hypothetical protein GCM10009654_30910 [Streptomyces hebeiensis]|uniref:Uncharacterized protein n=1 Tax=Streptomyces hebeiensis TaxID=229486 RepID=A0ABP4FEF3_9ACTN